MHSLRRDICRTSPFPIFSPAAQLTLKGWKNEHLEGLWKDASGGNTHKTCQRLHFSSFCTEPAAADAQSRERNSSCRDYETSQRWASTCLTFQIICFEKEVNVFLGPSAPVAVGALFVHQGCSIPQAGVQILARHRERRLPPAVTRARCDEKMVLTD